MSEVRRKTEEEQIQEDIARGVPMVIIHYDKDGNHTSEEAYNLQNGRPNQWQMEGLARATLKMAQKFFADPENRRKFEEWKAKPENQARLDVMLDEVRCGRFDVIVTQSLSQFGRDGEKSVALIRELASLPHPVGIYFVSEQLYSLDKSTANLLDLLV